MYSSNHSRRKFLAGLAKTGLLLPFSGQLLGQSFQSGGAQRVLFLYHPNGVWPRTWRPDQQYRPSDYGQRAIATSNPLSFCLAPLAPWHQKIIVMENLHLDGIPLGAHEGPTRGLMTGNPDINQNGASVDWLLAEALGGSPYILGVRTGSRGDFMISKPRGVNSRQRPIPTNNPKIAADDLARRMGGGEQDPNKLRLYETLLNDFEQLRDATLSLEATRRNKLLSHENALKQLQSQVNFVTGCGFTPGDVVDPHINGGVNAEDLGRFIPDVTRAQINNVVGALSCGLHKVATLQLFQSDEHNGYAHYAFDECWALMQMAIQDDRVRDGRNEPYDRWWSQHTSHYASHSVSYSTSAQSRWYNMMLAYTLEQLDARGILDDTLVVLFSEVGDGEAHGPSAGSVVLAGGASGELDMGRIIHCGNGDNSNTYRRYGTSDLYMDIARLMGVNSLEGWNGGGVVI